VLEGTIKLGGQEHFYLEPNGAIVIPTENDEYLLISSTQAPNKHQVSRARSSSMLCSVKLVAPATCLQQQGCTNCSKCMSMLR